jgi:hypothetical protein
VVQEFDFGNDPSADESHAVLSLQHLLASPKFLPLKKNILLMLLRFHGN